jgi:Tfp pilus assembly protein PilX
MKRSSQKGAALIFALIFVLVLSITAASLMFLSQSETWSSLNYRLMTQSRYGAEAGLHAAANFLMNNYTQPGVAGADLFTAYNSTVSPVTLAAGNSPIALGPTMNNVSANYPIPAVVTNFKTATQNSLTAGNNTVKYAVNAELLSMRQVEQCGNAQPLTAQLWKLTSHGDIQAVRNAEVEVSALLESHVTPCYNYAGFATGNSCNSIQFNGGGTIDSYDSSNLTLSGGTPVTQTYMGNLGSNGNLNTAPNTTVNGTFSSPDTGVGACGAGAGTTALSGNSTAVTGCSTSPTNCVPAPGLVKLPQTVTFVPPATDYPGCTPAPCSPAAQAAWDATVLSGLPNPPNALNPGNYGNVSAQGQQTVTLNPAGSYPNCGVGVYYINSISLSGRASITVNPCVGTGSNGGNPPPAQYMPVIINLVGSGTGTVMDIGGNGIANGTFDSSLMQFQYSGTAAINLHGNGSSSAVIYAPNAPVTLSGNGTIYGSVIGSQLLANGNPVTIHYDRNLSNKLFTVGNWTLDTFTWSKY